MSARNVNIGAVAETQTDTNGKAPAAASTEEAVAPARIARWKIVAAAMLLTAAAAGGWMYQRHAALYPSTDDAYVGAHVVQIAPLVSGRIQAVDVHDFQRVAAGDVLVRIDPRPLQAAHDGAQARLALARQQAAALDAAVAAARASQREAEASLADTERQTARVLTLATKGDASQAERDDATARLKTAQAALAAAKANVTAAEQQLGATGEANANVKAATAAVDSAALDLEHTTIRAPAAGIVGEVDVRPGAVVSAGLALFPLVDGSEWWVDANFKETDLAKIEPGQPAAVTLDLYPDRTISGTVVALSPASGASFSLLPPQNATGNWVKVTQRFPVRVALHIGDASPPLRIGATASVSIDTTANPTASMPHGRP